MSTDETYADDASNDKQTAGQGSYPGGPTDNKLGSLTKLNDIGHPRVPSMHHSYVQREIGNTGRTDVEFLTYVMGNTNRPALLEGESGVGKDVLVTHIAEETNRPVVRVNFGMDTSFETLVGMHHPTEDGHFEWRDGLLTSAVRNGWIFVADEVNAAPPEATMPLHGVTERRGNRHLTIQKTGEVLTDDADDGSQRIHPEFHFVGTKNPAHYPGVDEMNMAFKNRFVTVPINWIDSSAEVSIVLEETDMARSQAKQLVKLANELRSQLDGNTIRTPVSTRDMIKIGRMAGDGFIPLRQAAEEVLVSGAKPGDKNAFSNAVQRRID